MACCQILDGAPRRLSIQTNQPQAIYPNANLPVTPNPSEGRVISLLEELLKDQSSLKNAVEQHHQELTKRFDVHQQYLDAINATMSSVKLTTTGLESNVVKLTTYLECSSDHHSSSLVSIDSKDTSEVPFRNGSSCAAGTLKTRMASRKHGHVASILKSKKFDALAAGIIVANICSVLVSLQVKGLHLGWKLGERKDDSSWNAIKSLFGYLEYAYNVFYLTELSMRVAVYRTNFFKQGVNLLDFVIVIWLSLDSFVFKNMDINWVDLSFLRLFRIAKLLRAMTSVGELRVLLHTCFCAIPAVMWSAVLMGMIITGGGILMCQLALPYLEGDTIHKETRTWLYKNFGTSLISTYTMFVCTFTTSWVPYARRLMDDVSYAFALIWITWVVLINFATMRVVAALFLQKTLQVSSVDAERKAMNHLKRKKQMKEQLRQIFEKTDNSGDGIINEAEFQDMLQDLDIIKQLGSMGLDIDAIKAFFSVLASDDGGVDYREFISGAISMATSAPTLNHMISLQNHMKFERDMEIILENTAAGIKAQKGLVSSPCMSVHHSLSKVAMQ